MFYRILRQSLLFLILIIFGCNTEPSEDHEGKDKPQEIKRLFNDGSYHIYQRDNLGYEHGFYRIFSGDSLLLQESRYYHGQEVSRSFFEKGNRVNDNVFRVKDKGINVYIKYDSKGNVIRDKSNYANIEYVGEKKDSLHVELHGFYKDSIVVLFRKSFDDHYNVKNYLRLVSFVKPKQAEFTIDLKYEDYWNNRLNIQVLTFDKSNSQNEEEDFNNSKIKISSSCKQMFIQLDRGEKPKKYNLDPIW